MACRKCIDAIRNSAQNEYILSAGDVHELSYGKHQIYRIHGCVVDNLAIEKRNK